MTFDPGALLELKWTVGPDDEPAFDAWYDEEHLDDLLAVPGVLEARRLARVGGRGPLSGEDNHLTHYWLRDRAVLEEPAYLRLGQDPSERTREVAFGLPLERHIHDRVEPPSPGPARSSSDAGLLVVSVVAPAGSGPAAAWAAWLDAVAAVAGGPRLRVRRPEPDPPAGDPPGTEPLDAGHPSGDERTTDLVELAEVGADLLDVLEASVPRPPQGETASDAWGLELYRQRYAKTPLAT